MKVRKNRVVKVQKWRIVKIAILAFFILVASLSALIGFRVYDQIKDFKIDNLSLTSTSTILDANNDTIYRYGGVAGKYIYYDDIPEVMIDAIIATEDARFFTHSGFDLPRIVRAFISNLMHGHITSGGSTITQQLIKKTYYPDEARTIERKIGEVILAIEATQQTTKEKVLELYLNKIYFGRTTNTVGLYAASYYYFDKHPSELTLPEAALLAGTLNSPATYDPYRHLDLAEKRRNTVLRLMRNHGYITPEKCEATMAIPVANTLKYKPVRTTNAYASYVDRVTKEVKKRTGYDPNAINMTIYTYMDKDIQSTLDDIASGKSYTYSDPDMQAGSTVLESHTGRITGIMAAKDYVHGNYDFSAEKHQPGSSIKPILDYGPAFEYLYWSNGHYVEDAKLKIGSWSPKNFDGKTHGTISLNEALGRSYNLAAIATLQKVMETKSSDDMVSWLKNLGYEMDQENFSMPFAIGAWTYGTTTAQQAAAYAAISNGGTYIEPHTIEKIVINTTQKTIYIDDDIQSSARKAMAPSTAFMLRKVMTAYVKEYKNYSGLDIGDEIGAKTGTSNHDGSIKGIPSGKDKDHWLCCYSPDYAWATWNGYPGTVQKEKGKYQVSGQNDAREISVLIGKALHQKGIKNTYETPDNVVEADMIKETYPYASPSRYTSSSRILRAWFIKGYEPKDISGVSDQVTDEIRLKGFSASYDNNVIHVNFNADNPTSSNLNYVVEIYSGSTKLSQEEFSSASADLAFQGEIGQTYRLVGYVTLGSFTSNQLSTNVTTGHKSSVGSATFSVTDGSNTLSSGTTTTSHNITVHTNGPSTSTIIIKVDGSTTQISCGESKTFQLSAGSHAISCTEMDEYGYTSQVGSMSFTITGTENTETEDAYE